MPYFCSSLKNLHKSTMLKYIPFILFIYLTVPSIYSCKSKTVVTKPTRDTLTQEIIDSLVRNSVQQAVTYKGILVSYGGREFNFTIDSGKMASFDLESASSAIQMTIFEEKSKSFTKDSVTSYTKGFEKVADTTFWSKNITHKTNFKVKLDLSQEAIKSEEIVKFVLKVKK